jgi:proteasome lid subunit RPN8/RPN11
MIVLKHKQFDSIYRHGEADYPNECCGLLIGRFEDDRKIVEDTFLLSNAREEESKRRRFLITPEEYSRGAQKAAQRRLDVIGFYHSHPDHPARPSSFDLEHAWPVYSYVIVSVIQGKGILLLSWELKDDRSGFESEIVLQRA